ncbi:uncharacterized protein LOC129796531 [Lutzomyia longipalpis]|uniref:uncharacterized protein LOC129796531 n=1 Tax=Lutzomyia longipalpis TaxID=7200 RepID=UPI0024842ADD|nr:uncharacterized protein LOC129796531 [Lutzomyia longipalpis]
MFKGMLCILVVLKCCSGQQSASPIAFEATPSDLMQFQQYCSKFDIETGTLVAHRRKIPNLFYKLNSKCYRRLLAHRFLWVDETYAEKFKNSQIHILERTTEDSMLNLANTIDRNVRENRAYILVELIPRTISRVIEIRKNKVWKRQTLKTPMQYVAEKKTHTTIIRNEKVICLNFQGYYQIKTKGKINIEDFGNSLCYKVYENVVVPKDILKVGAPLRQVQAQRQIIIYEADVELMVQTSEKEMGLLKLPVMIKEETIAIKTLTII